MANYQDVIKSLIDTYGEHVIDDAQRFESLLLDHFSDSWRETKLILYGLHVDIAWEMRDSPDTTVSMHSVERLSQKLYDEYGIEWELAYWVIEEWAGVFDKTIEETEPESKESDDEDEDEVAPDETAGSRGHFRAVLWTAIVTAGVMYGAFRIWGDIPQPELSEVTGVVQESAVENSRQANAEITFSVGTRQRSQQEESLIQENSRFSLTVRDAITDEKYQVFIYAKDEEAFEEPKDWKWGKKGDPIYKGRYDFYLQQADGSLAYEFRHDEYRFNMNHNMAFTSEKNDSVIIVAQYDMTGMDPHYMMYQLLEGEFKYVGMEFGIKFSEKMVSDELIN